MRKIIHFEIQSQIQFSSTNSSIKPPPGHFRKGQNGAPMTFETSFQNLKSKIKTFGILLTHCADVTFVYFWLASAIFTARIFIYTCIGIS